MANCRPRQDVPRGGVTYLDAAVSVSLGFSVFEHAADVLRAWQNLEKTQHLTILCMWINTPNKTKTEKPIRRTLNHSS